MALPYIKSHYYHSSKHISEQTQLCNIYWFAISPAIFSGKIATLGLIKPFRYPKIPLCLMLVPIKTTVVTNAKPTVVFKSAVGLLVQLKFHSHLHSSKSRVLEKMKLY